MFYVLEKELEWRKQRGIPEGFETLRKSRPLVSIGATKPLDDQPTAMDFFHGVDGLCGIHDSHKHLTPPETWKHIFESLSSSTLPTTTLESSTDSISHALFTPSQRPSHLEILRLLDLNPPNTIMIVALGPLTDLALAASIAPKTLMRAKSIVVMGGAISGPGNITPLAEFNFYADPVAAARIFALTSHEPSSTMPLTPLGSLSPSTLPPYPPKEEVGLERLPVLLFTLDLAQQHSVRRGEFKAKVNPLMKNGSPLAEWTNAFMDPIFDKLDPQQEQNPSNVSCYMPDPLCAWYAITTKSALGKWVFSEYEDIRVETSGQWARGACCIDRRGWPKRDGLEESAVDEGRWLSSAAGNSIQRCIGTPGLGALAPFMLETIFGAD
ncbi:hypothetical protein MMC22_010991 [Lobaria immixta]|nr:hypothetical protein [Lobaria immixta]